MTARRFTLAALALALLTTACSENATAPAPDVSARPARRQPQQTVTSAELADRITLYDGAIRYDIDRLTRDGSVTESRILKDGAPFITMAGDIATVASDAVIPVTLYDEGSIILNEPMSLWQDTTLAAPRWRPRRAMSLDEQPCLEEAMAFLAASAWLGAELYLLKHRPTQASFRRIKAAGMAVMGAGQLLWQCYQQAEGRGL